MTKIIQKVVSQLYTIENKKYINITRNQLQILDALMKDGGYNKKYIDKHNKLRFSEHFGMLDFNNAGLEKVIISGKSNRMDKDDHEILLPDDVPDALDYEYIFHTHPPTPKPGGRVQSGILYEFPSIADIFHFAEHYNDGKTQGSIIITPEGLYLIRCKKDDKKIKIPSEKKYNEMVQELIKIQEVAIKKYGKKISENDFYKKVANDFTYIKMFNKMLKRFWNDTIFVNYKPRKYDATAKQWYIPGFYIPVSVIEPKK